MQSDYIMRIVEQFVQAILAIRKNRIAGKKEEAREQIKMAARYFLRVDLDYFLLYDLDFQLSHFKDSQGGLDREKCRLFAELLNELALIEGEGNKIHHIKRSYDAFLESGRRF